MWSGLCNLFSQSGSGRFTSDDLQNILSIVNSHSMKIDPPYTVQIMGAGLLRCSRPALKVGLFPNPPLQSIDHLE